MSKFILCIAFLSSLNFSCGLPSKKLLNKGLLEITKIDSTKDFYVFRIGKISQKLIVIAEKDQVMMCMPFKKFIIADSIKEVGIIKAGSRNIGIGARGFVMDGVRIKYPEELAKIITSCKAFTN
jgi:hypothetical protein